MIARERHVPAAADEFRYSTDVISLRWSAVTDRGRKRAANEDSVFASFPVYIVADGMGGHTAGDVASALAVEAFRSLKGAALAQVEDVERAVDRAFRAVVQEQVDERPSGTTLTGAVLVNVEGEPHWLIVNVGDSRTYLLTEGTLEQVSVDHSLMQELIESGDVHPDDARRHPDRSVITRAIGAGQDHLPDYWLLPAERGQRLLVCSDGLSGEIDDERIRGILSATPYPADAAQSLMNAALDAGGRDNVSVIVADIDAVLNDAPFGDTASVIDDDTVPRKP